MLTARNADGRLSKPWCLDDCHASIRPSRSLISVSDLIYGNKVHAAFCKSAKCHEISVSAEKGIDCVCLALCRDSWVIFALCWSGGV